MDSPSLSQNTETEAPRRQIGTAIVLAALSVFSAEHAGADDAPERGVIALKYLDYFDSQPGKDRIAVKATSLKIIAPISGKWSFGASGTIDSISGASPAYHNSGFGKVVDRRNAVDADLTHYFDNSSVSLGINHSKELDYESRGLSILAKLQSEDRNTSWNAAIAMNHDKINPSNRIVSNERKQLADFLLGLTQVVTDSDIIQFNVGFSRGHGYYSDPYKVFDERPRFRRSTTSTVRWNHHFGNQNSIGRLSYRYYADTWGIRAHTIGAEYAQPVAHGWAITPSVRLYAQSAADFYVDAGPIDFPFPPNPPSDWPYFSEDQRLSGFGALTLGCKFSKQLNDDWVIDIKFEQYRQRATYQYYGNASAGLLPFNARMLQFGLSRQF